MATDQDANVAPAQAAIDDALAAGHLVPPGLTGSDDASALDMLACALREIAARQLEWGPAKPETRAGLASLVKALQKLAQDQRSALQAFVQSAEELLNAEAVATAKASIEAQLAHHQQETKRLQEQLSQLGTPAKKNRRTAAPTPTGAGEGSAGGNGAAAAATASATATAAAASSAATAVPTATAGTSEGLTGDVGVCLMGLSRKKVCPKSRDTSQVHDHVSAGELARVLGYREGRVVMSTYSGTVKVIAANGKEETLAKYLHGRRVVEMYDTTRREVSVSKSCATCNESVTTLKCLFGKGTGHMTAYLGELGVPVEQP